MGYRLSAKILITLGRNIRKIRKQQGRTIDDVSFEAGIEPSYYSKLERGEANPSLEKVYAIIRALHIRSSDILPF